VIFDPPDWAARAAMGLEPEDFEDEILELWPDNLLTVNLFSAMCHQWRSGMSGYYGMDLNVLPIFEERMKVPLDQRDEIFESLLLMERAALEMLQKRAHQ
jgi:hypothetical protein